MGICEDAPDEYCGHVLNTDEWDTDDYWLEDTRNAVCLRKPKYDGLCVWHADTDEKSATELVEARLTPDDVPWETEYVKEHLSGAILRNVKFPNKFSFSGCILIGSKFTNTQVQSSEWMDTDLRLSNISGCDFECAKFSRAKIQSTTFCQTNLRCSTFIDSDLRQAVLMRVDLPDSKFHESGLPGAKFQFSYLPGAVFENTDLPGVEFQHTNLRGVEFLDAGLPGADFSNSFLYGTQFSKSNLNTVDFSSSYLQETKFQNTQCHKSTHTNTKLQRAKFTKSDLRRAEFTEADLRESEFTETDLRGIRFQSACATLIQGECADNSVRFPRTGAGVSITPPDDTIKDLRGASLEDAQLEDGTDLRGADLSGARLYQTAFRDVRINDETKFGVDDEEKPGKACRYEYDPNAGVSINESTSRFEAAAWTYRRLESLFEENAMDERARNAHIRKEEAQRAYHAEQIKEDDWIDEGTLPPDHWLKSLGEYAVSTINWHLHRHGESLRRLLGVSGLLIFLCGFIYAGAGIARNNPETTYQITLADLTNPGAVLIDLLNGWYFSVITFSTIGYGDFYPISPLSRLLVGIESLLGALLIALFVFVIGRRVAR